MTKINKKVVIFENGKTPMRKVNESLDDNGKKLYILEGACASFDGKNNNGRTYDKDEYLKHFDYLLPQIEQRALAGSLDHPEDDENEEHDIFTPKMKDLSHLITKLWYKDETDEVWIQIQLLDTAWGRDAMACVDAGMPIFISSRASGYIAEDGRVTLDQIYTYDIVYRPGFANAKLAPVIESFESKTSYTTIFECKQHTPAAPAKTEDTVTRKELNRILESFRSSINKMKKVNECLDVPAVVTTETLDKMGMDDALYLPSLLKFLRDDQVDLKTRYDYMNRYATAIIGTPLDAEPTEAIMKDTIAAFIESNEIQYITDCDRAASVSESLRLANKNVSAIKESFDDCSADDAMCMTRDFVETESKPDEEKVDLVKAYLTTFDPEDKLKLANVPQEDLLPAFIELDPASEIVPDAVVDVRQIYNRLSAEMRDRINADNITVERVNKVTDWLNVVAKEFNTLADRFDANVSTVKADYQQLVDYCSVLESRINSLSDFVNSIVQTVNDTADTADVTAQRVDTLADYATVIAGTVNDLSTNVEETAIAVEENKKNKKITESIDAKISKAIETVIKTKQNNRTPQRVNENASKQRVFESNGELKVPARYQQSWNRLDAQRKNEIVCLFEMRQPRTVEESDAIWESLDLGRRSLIAAERTPVQAATSTLGYDDNSIDAALGF